MIDALKIEKVKWEMFNINHPITHSFVDCWVTYRNGNEYFFRFQHDPPKYSPDILWRLGSPYDYLIDFGRSGELPPEFYSEFVYRCNNWYPYAIVYKR